jgi:hypothetical protein
MLAAPFLESSWSGQAAGQSPRFKQDFDCTSSHFTSFLEWCLINEIYSNFTSIAFNYSCKPFMISIKISINRFFRTVKSNADFRWLQRLCFIKCIGNERQKKIITVDHFLGSSHLSTVFNCTLSSFRYTSHNTSVKWAIHKKCSHKAIRLNRLRRGYDTMNPSAMISPEYAWAPVC